MISFASDPRHLLHSPILRLTPAPAPTLMSFFSKHTHLYARQSVCIQCLVRMSHCVVSEVPNDLPMISPKKLVLKKLCRKKLSLKNIFKSPTSCRHPCTRLPSGCSPAILNFFLIPIERCVRKRCGRDDEAVMMRGRGSCLRCV